MNYGYFKDLNRRAAADKALCDKAFNIVKNPIYGYQRGIVSVVYWFFYKNVKNENISDK